MKKRGLQFSAYFLQDMNPVIRFLIISDTVVIGAGGLLGPIFALFVEDYIQGGNEAVAGIAAGLFLFTKSILQVPIAHLIDRIRGEKDDFWLLFIGSILMGLLPLAYLVTHTPLQLYLIQLVMGAVTAFTFPTYMAIFTRHIDPKKEGTEWGVYYTLTDLMCALLAALGGLLATTQGFQNLILIVVIASVTGALLLYPVKPYIRTTRSRTR